MSAISQSLVEMTSLKTLWLQGKLLLFIYTAHDMFLFVVLVVVIAAAAAETMPTMTIILTIIILVVVTSTTP